MADVINFGDAAATFDRDRKVFELRLHGVSPRKIAEQLRCSVREVEASVIRMTGGVSPALRARTIGLELERLDALMASYFEEAIKHPGHPDQAPNTEYAALVLKIMERRAKLLGLDAPPRGDTALDEMMKGVAETSTERVRAVINRIRGRNDTIIDGEAVAVDKKPED